LRNKLDRYRLDRKLLSDTQPDGSINRSDVEDRTESS